MECADKFLIKFMEFRNSIIIYFTSFNDYSLIVLFGPKQILQYEIKLWALWDHLELMFVLICVLKVKRHEFMFISIV